MIAGFNCANCGEWNETDVDPSQGEEQEYYEDCQVCCTPNLLRAEWTGGGEFRIEASLDD